MKEIKLTDVDEVIYYDVCDNGLPIYMWPNNKVNSFYITLTARYGSIHTKFKLNNKSKVYEVPSGSAHYLEHVKFNEPDGTTAHEYFAKLGSDVNAFTVPDYTTYQVFASTEFEKNLNHLLDYVMTSCITKKLVNKERGIITEEANMGQDNPYQKLMYSFYRNIFKNLNYRIETIGTLEDIKKINEKDLQLIFDTFYHPQNMILVITGNFNPYEAAAMVKENQKKKEFLPYRKPEFVGEKEPTQVVKKYEEITGNIGEHKIKVGLKLLDSRFKMKDKIKLRIILRMIMNINFGVTSEFRNELLEKELITSLNSLVYFFQNYLIIDVTSQTKYPEEVTKKIVAKLENLDVTEETISRRIKANIANLILDYDDIEYVNSNIVNALIYDGKITNSYKKIYESITMEDVNKVLKLIDLKHMSIIEMLPNEN